MYYIIKYRKGCMCFQVVYYGISINIPDKAQLTPGPAAGFTFKKRQTSVMRGSRLFEIRLGGNNTHAPMFNSDRCGLCSSVPCASDLLIDPHRLCPHHDALKTKQQIKLVSILQLVNCSCTLFQLQESQEKRRTESVVND